MLSNVWDILMLNNCLICILSGNPMQDREMKAPGREACQKLGTWLGYLRVNLPFVLYFTMWFFLSVILRFTYSPGEYYFIPILEFKLRLREVQDPVQLTRCTRRHPSSSLWDLSRPQVSTLKRARTGLQACSSSAQGLPSLWWWISGVILTGIWGDQIFGWMIFLGVSMKVFLAEISIWISRPSKASHPPQCR